MRSVLTVGFGIASACNSLAAAKLLHSRGAEISSIDRGGGLPLDRVVCQCSPEFRAWLVSVGGKHRDDSHGPWPWLPGHMCEVIRVPGDFAVELVCGNEL